MKYPYLKKVNLQNMIIGEEFVYRNTKIIYFIKKK